MSEFYPKMNRVKLTEAFNRKFGLDRPKSSVIACLKNHRISSGRRGGFKKGQKPWNLGLKGYMGANKTSFKKGNLPHNHRPLWSERIDKDGVVEMSVPEINPRTGFESHFKAKHVWLWEQENGEVPKGSVVIFKGGDKRNFAQDNFLLVTRKQLLVLNLHGYKDKPNELKPSIMALAKLEAEGGFRTCPGRGRTRKS